MFQYPTPSPLPHQVKDKYSGKTNNHDTDFCVSFGQCYKFYFYLLIYLCFHLLVGKIQALNLLQLGKIKP